MYIIRLQLILTDIFALDLLFASFSSFSFLFVRLSLSLDSLSNSFFLSLLLSLSHMLVLLQAKRVTVPDSSCLLPAIELVCAATGNTIPFAPVRFVSTALFSTT
jgi:hypothetical protein